MSSALLPIMIVVPVVGAAIVGVIPARRAELFRPVALLTGITVLGMAVYMLVSFKVGVPGYQFETSTTWIADLGISLHFGVDGISLFLVVLAAGIFPIALLGSEPHHDPKPYYGWLLVLLAGSIGVFCALDL
ncbi:MAG: Fe-S-binding domain-containing protein, partial [Actinomycetes bacterium]